MLRQLKKNIDERTAPNAPNTREGVTHQRAPNEGQKGGQARGAVRGHASAAAFAGEAERPQRTHRHHTVALRHARSAAADDG